MKKFFLSAFLILNSCILLLTSTPVSSYADANFTTSFDITYTVNQLGITHAVFNGVLQNTSNQYYASSYSLQTGFDDISHVTAFDTDGTIIPGIYKTGGGNVITLSFNKQAVGLNQVEAFTFAFDTPNIATHVGSIWEINIPGIADAPEFKNFAVHLRVPPSFAQPVFIKPQQPGNGLDFTKDTVGSSGISLTFGNQQTFNYTLIYHLKNSELFPVSTDIALPPTTNYQDVSIASMNPKPLNVFLDADGNWLATYHLLPSQKIDVLVKGSASINLNPKKEVLSDTLRKQYTQATTYWEQNSQITQLAHELQTPRAIYDYVVSHLHYDFSRVAGNQERLGAAAVLLAPQSAVCLEFTDLFVALSRAAGIPAREIDGYAYTQNTKERPLSLVKDILHAWPEYYDDSKGAWIMVDPTWGNTTKGTDYFTTLDFDHFAFVLKGIRSTTPIPAGGYKITGAEKDVFVTFGDTFPMSLPQVTLDFSTTQSLFPATKLQGKLQISNVALTLVPPQVIGITSSFLTPLSQTTYSAAIPPFGYITRLVSFDDPSPLTNANESITIQVGGSTVTKTVSIYPFFLQKNNLILGGIIIVLLSIAIFIATAKSRRLPSAE